MAEITLEEAKLNAKRLVQVAMFSIVAAENAVTKLIELEERESNSALAHIEAAEKIFKEASDAYASAKSDCIDKFQGLTPDKEFHDFELIDRFQEKQELYNRAKKLYEEATEHSPSNKTCLRNEINEIKNKIDSIKKEYTDCESEYTNTPKLYYYGIPDEYYRIRGDKQWDLIRKMDTLRDSLPPLKQLLYEKTKKLITIEYSEGLRIRMPPETDTKLFVN